MNDSAKENLHQLRVLLSNISNDDYTKQTEILTGSTIGDHFRHILEFYLLLVSGASSGTISYDLRPRDERIATNVKFATETVDKILAGLGGLQVNDALILEADYTKVGENSNKINTTVGRELAYCIEHSIHHQALIKAALIAIGQSKLTDNNFGVAYSTIRYRSNTCVQ